MNSVAQVLLFYPDGKRSSSADPALDIAPDGGAMARIQPPPPRQPGEHCSIISTVIQPNVYPYSRDLDGNWHYGDRSSPPLAARSAPYQINMAWLSIPMSAVTHGCRQARLAWEADRLSRKPLS